MWGLFVYVIRDPFCKIFMESKKLTRIFKSYFQISMPLWHSEKICFRGHVCIYLQRRSRKLRLCNMKCIVPSSKPTDNLLMVAGARINPKWLDFLPAPAASQYIRSNFHQEIWNLGSLKYQRKQKTKWKYEKLFSSNIELD